MRVKMWTKEESAYLLQHYEKYCSLTGLAEHFGTTIGAVRSKANRLGFSRKNPKCRWSQEELDLLEAWAETKPFLELVEAWQVRSKRKKWPKRCLRRLRYA